MAASASAGGEGGQQHGGTGDWRGGGGEKESADRTATGTESSAVGRVLAWSRRFLLGARARLPIIDYYAYLWARERSLLVQTLAVNYALPVIYEVLPWFLSRAHLSRYLRHTRNTLRHGLVVGRPMQGPTVLTYFAMTLVYSAIHTLDLTLRNRVALRNRLVLKRLMMERILFSELGSLQSRCRAVFGDEVRPDDLESRVFADLNMALYLFNTLIPSALRGAVQFGRSTADLYARRDRIDPLAVLRPTLISVAGEAVAMLRERWVDRGQQQANVQNSASSSRVVTTIVDGLGDIQLNNMQLFQLGLLDRVGLEEVNSKEGVTTFFDRVYRTVSGQGVFDFISELYVVHHVMRTQEISHEAYREVQNDVDYVVRLGIRTFNQLRQGWTILDTQHQVMTVLDLPSFADEEQAVQRYLEAAKDVRGSQTPTPGPEDVAAAAREFRSLVVQQLRFHYEPNLPAVLDLSASLVFERGVTYAIAGQNRSGKSTLVKIICKLHQATWNPATGTGNGFGESRVLLNGVPFELVPRQPYRRRISYVSQRPFFFPGTVEDNIRVGRPEATRAEIEEAARLAGLLLRERGSSDQPPESPASLPLGLVTNSLASVDDLGDSGDGLEPSLLRPAPAEFRPGPRGVSGLKPWERDRALWRRILSKALSALHDYVVDEETMEPEADDEVIRGGVESDGAVRAADGGAGPSEAGSESERISRLLSMPLELGAANVSGGFAQSVALARVFLRRDSQVVILDEALGQMDTIKKREHIMPNLLRFVRQNNMTLIIISHDVVTTCPLVDTVYVLKDGRLAHQGSHEELVASGATEYVRLLGHEQPPASA